MMREIETVSILGAGAMGASYAAILYDADPESVTLIAGGKRYDRLTQHGVMVNDRQYHIPVVRPRDPGPPSDLVLVALKHHHLAGAVEDLRQRVGPETVILSIMNGLDSETMLSEAYGPDKVLYTVSVGMDAVREGNRVTYTRQNKLLFGEADNTILSASVRRVQRFFDRAGLAYETPQDMIRVLWWKWMINVGINQASAVLRAPYGKFQQSPQACELMESAMREAVALAQAQEIALGEPDIAHWYELLYTLAPEGKTSMLQDIEAGRKTEVEMFAGKAVELGERYSVPTPVNQSMLRLIRAMERG